MKKYPLLFSPVKVGPYTLKNRIEASPVNISNLTQDGYLTPENIAIFEGKARRYCPISTPPPTPSKSTTPSPPWS